MDIVKNLKANLGGTDISSPLKDIFNSKDYDDINLGRNLFILTDGEVDNREECLELISINAEKFKVHAIVIGSSFDKKLIQNAGIQGKGSYHFVQNVSEVNSIIIQSLSKCLRNYLLNIKLGLDKIKPEYEFMPKMNFIYPDEILNYYFILKGKNNENIKINFESAKKNDSIPFSNEKIIKEEDGEIVGQIIIANILKNSDDKLDENMEIKLSKNYQVLSKKTSLFAVAEGDESNKIAEFKQVKKKEKPKINNFYNSLFNNNNNNFFNAMDEEEDNHHHHDRMGRGMAMKRKERAMDYDMAMAKPKKKAKAMKKCMNKESAPKMKMLYKKANFSAPKNDEDEDEDFEEKKCKKSKCKKSKVENKDEDMMEEEDDKFEFDAKQISSECFIENIKKEKEKEEKIEFSNKELILTQDIFDGCWKLNPQTNLLIEKMKIIYETIEKILKNKNLEKEEIKVPLLVLYYLNTDSSINKMEYSLIMKKAVAFLEKNGINFEEIMNSIKN